MEKPNENTVCAEVRAEAWFFLPSLAAKGLTLMLAAPKVGRQELGGVEKGDLVGNDKKLSDYKQVQKSAERKTKN